MGTAQRVRRAEVDEFDRIVDAFGRATLDEAVTAWIMEDFPAEGLLTDYVPSIVQRGISNDEVWVAGTEDEIWTVSIWQTVTSLQRFDDDAAAAAAHAEQGPDLRPLQRAAAATGLLAREHPQQFPHSYVQVMVTVPEHRGKGAGAAILADRLHAGAAAGVPAFLEASTQRSARLYARQGFVPDAQVHQLPEGGPTLIPMWYRP